LWLRNYIKDDSISLPIAHGEGRYQCSAETLNKLQDEDSIAIRYQDNPNGSINDIAGITNKRGNVLGMMPHPERACDSSLGSIDGKLILSSLLS